MKQFKRKLARLFSLALRSDLDRINGAYKWEQEEHEYHAKQSERYKKLWRDTQKAYEVLIKEIEVLDIKLANKTVSARKRKLEINKLNKFIIRMDEEDIETHDKLIDTLSTKDDYIHTLRKMRNEAQKNENIYKTDLLVMLDPEVRMAVKIGVLKEYGYPVDMSKVAYYYTVKPQESQRQLNQ